MLKMFCIYIMISVGVLSFLATCSTMQKTAGTEKPAAGKALGTEAEKIQHPTQREAESLSVFSGILDLVQTSADRNAILPELEKRYMEIIKEYYDTPLAQESYWRLIAVYVDDYSPPAYEKAEPLYREFMKKYPDSPFRGFIEETMGKSYYKNAQWEKLLDVSAPAFKGYTEEGKRPKPSLMFMYAEANFNLGSFAEAEKGYRTFLEAFPKVIESMKAKKRLEEIGRP